MTVPRRASSQLFPQILRSRYWLVAGKSFADVGGGLAVHHRTVSEQVGGSHGRGRWRDYHDQVGSPRRANLGDQLSRSLVSRVTHDGDLHLLRQSEITCTKPASEASRIVDGQIGHKAKRSLGQPSSLCGAREGSKGQQGLCGERISRWDSVVLQVLWAYKQLLRAVGRIEKPSGGVSEAGQHLFGEKPRGHEPAVVEVRLVQLQQSKNQRSTIVQVGLRPRRSRTPSAPQLSVGSQRCEQEVCVANGDIKVLLVPEGTCRLGKRGQHQAVPGCQHRVVSGWAYPRVTDFEEPCTAPVQQRGDVARAHKMTRSKRRVIHGALQDVCPLPRALVSHTIGRGEQIDILPERRTNLLEAPDIKLALHSHRACVE